MRSVLNLCDDYAAQYDVLFNAKKSKCIRCNPIGAVKYSSRFTYNPSFFIGSNYIEFVDKWPYLGHLITDDCDDIEDIKAKKSSLIGQINKILCTFSSVNCRTKAKLVKSYCTSFYGAELWDQSNLGIESISAAWRKGLRRIWQVPCITHSALIPGLCETLPLVDLFYKRMLNFVYRCLKSESLLVGFIVRHGMSSGEMDSLVGRNVLNCSLRYNTSIDRISKLEFRPNSIVKHVCTCHDNSFNADLLSELLLCEDGTMCLSNPNFSSSDVSAMIYILCTC
jgi:hypothetical protein